MKLWLKLCNTEAEDKNRVAYKSVHYIKGGWVPVGRKKLLNGIEMGVGPSGLAGKNAKICENGWVGVFYGKTSFFSICSAIFFLASPRNLSKSSN